MKLVKTIQLKIVIFTAVKNRCILHGRVFVMSALLLFSKSNHRFHSLSQDVAFTMPRILKYVKITMHLQLIFNACAAIVVLLCFRWLQY